MLHHFHLPASLILLAASLPISSAAADIVYSYNPNALPAQGYGYNRPDSYEICVKLQEPAITGAEVRSISVEIPDDGGSKYAPDVKAWIIAELPEGSIAEGTPIAMVDAKVEDNLLTATFPAGIHLPADGLYVGYSIEATEIYKSSRKFPVAVVDAATPGGLYIRTALHPRWDEAFTRLEQVSAMEVTISGDFNDAAAIATFADGTLAKRGEELTLPVSILNQSTTPIERATLTFTIDGQPAGEQELKFDPPIPGRFNACGEGTISIMMPEELGDHQLALTVATLDNQPNSSQFATADGRVRSVPEMPVNRPLVEEYTGLWCGSCPQGWVALEEMREKYGSDFVAIVYHVNDDLTTSVAPPNSANNVPTIYVNRSYSMGGDTLPAYWAEQSAKQVNVAMDIDLCWTDDRHTALEATATATFMEDMEAAGYRFTMALVADHLSSPSWKQANYFSGQNRTGKFWDLFTQGGAYVYGLEYNSTLCLYPDVNGVAGSIPLSPREFEPYTFTRTFNLSEALSRAGVNLIQNADALRVIAIIVEPVSGRVINCISSCLSSEAREDSAVKEIDSEESASLESEKWYSLSGIEIATPAPGEPAIRQRVFTDGTRETRIIISKHHHL